MPTPTPFSNPTPVPASAPGPAAAPVMLIGQPVLRKHANEVATDPQTLWACMARLVNVLGQKGYNQPLGSTFIGGGLSGPQIGRQERTFLAINPVDSTWHFFANPVITATASTTWDSASAEGCLSIPSTELGSVGSIPRYEQYSISYDTLVDATGKNILQTTLPLPLLPTLPPAIQVQSKRLTTLITYDETAGPTAEANAFNWILQHEVDHLNGVLFTDYANLKTPYNSSTEVSQFANELLGRAQDIYITTHYPIAKNVAITGTAPAELPTAQQALIYGTK